MALKSKTNTALISTGDPILNFITSNRMALWLTLGAIVVLFPNAFYVFYKLGGDMPIPGLRLAQALLGGLYISGSIAYFTLNKNYKVAYAFAIFEMFLSFFYYWNRLMFTEQGNFHLNFWIIPACLIALFLPWSVKNYAASIKISEELPSDAIEALSRYAAEFKFSKMDDSIGFPYNKKDLELNEEDAPIYPDEFNADIEHIFPEGSERFNFRPTARTVDSMDAKHLFKENARLYDEITQHEAAHVHNKEEIERAAKLNIELEDRVKALEETVEDNDSELIAAGEKIEALEQEKNLLQLDINNAEVNRERFYELKTQNESLEKEKETLIKEKDWYKDIALKYQSQENKVSPIFQNTPL